MLRMSLGGTRASGQPLPRNSAFSLLVLPDSTGGHRPWRIWQTQRLQSRRTSKKLNCSKLRPLNGCLPNLAISTTIPCKRHAPHFFVVLYDRRTSCASLTYPPCFSFHLIAMH